ncbi:MAG: lysophospholipid acyltransferase family protein [Acidobacteriota bacterium]|nr:lysophospholipid acyltransferase family protein [Acidobacteriota bacterium]
MPKKRSSFQTKIEYYAVRALIGAIGVFPLKMSMRIGKGAGKFIGSLIPKLKKIGRRNLEIALPELNEAEREKILNGTFQSLGRQLGLVAHFDEFTPERVRELVEVVGKEHFDKAYRQGNGVLFFTGHFGSWEVFSLLPPAFGHTMNILVRRIDNPLVENFVDNLRTRLGCKTLDKSQSARQMFRVLKKGELLGILADLNVQEKEGVFVDFFGTSASTTTGIAKLALATNAAVLPAFAVWNEAKQKYVVHLEPAVNYKKTDDAEEDVKALTQKITNVVEQYVRAFPEQWLWIHKRWNTRPAGETELYF